LQSKLHKEKYISTTLILIRYHLWGAKYGGIYLLFACTGAHVSTHAHTPNYLHIKILINKNKYIKQW